MPSKWTCLVCDTRTAKVPAAYRICWDGEANVIEGLICGDCYEAINTPLVDGSLYGISDIKIEGTRQK